MFVEQSVARLWRVRTAFVLLCLFPAVGLVTWAVQRSSAAHRAAVANAAAKLLGTTVTIEQLAHPQPGCFRLSGVQIGGTNLPAVEVETTPDEVRLRLETLTCTPETVPLVVAVIRRWLNEPAGFDRNCVLDIGQLSWGQAESAADLNRPLRVECVAAGTGRAVRIFSVGMPADELRIVRTQAEAPGSVPTAERLEVEASLSQAMPAAIVAAACGELFLGQWKLGQQALIEGRLQAALAGGHWSGEAAGTITQVDLAQMTASLPNSLEGLASISVEELVWAGSRLSAVDCVCTAPRGGVDQAWLEGLVSIMGCRPATAFRDPLNGGFRDFERLGCRVTIDASGVRLRALPQQAGCLVESQGLPLVKEPVGEASLDRLAWLLSGTAPPAVPGTPTTAWLLSVLPLPRTSR